MAEHNIRQTCIYLAAAARRIWGWDSERRAVLNESERRAGDRGKRICALCGRVYPKKEIQVDHIIQVGSVPRVFEGWDDYFTRMFTTRDNLRALCKECHKGKSRQDGVDRRKKAA